MKTAFLLAILIVTTSTVDVNAQEPEPILCTREGPTCKDCHTLGYCIGTTDKGFDYDPTKDSKCVIGWACDEYSLQCIRNGTCRFNESVCPPNKFDVETLYPDPYSCNGFYGCQGAEQFHYQCPVGKAYDPKLKYCSLNANDPECYDYPALCEKTGQTGTIGDIDYECVEGKDEEGTHTIYPKFTSDIGSTTTEQTTTQPTTTEQTTTQSTTTEQTTTQSTTTEQTTTQSTTTEQTTTQSTTTEQTTTQSTTTEQTTTQSTTTEQTTTQSTTTEQTTTKPTTTEPTTTESTTTQRSSTSTAPTSTLVPFVCRDEGVFADPSNCKMFYMCICVGEVFEMLHLACSMGSYFDPLSNECVPGECHN